MSFCLPKHLVDTFLGKLKSGEINPDKLAEMSSADRNAFFAEFMGPDNATKVNVLFESKLLLKNQQLGMINWAKKISGMKQDAKRDLISRINRMTEVLQPDNKDAFLSDLAKQRLRIGVTVEEAGKISDLAKRVTDKKELVKQDSPIGSDERLRYGLALTEFKDYVSELKKDTIGERFKTVGGFIQETFGFMKSVLASMDNSFFGRQGMVTLFNNPIVWAKNFKKSWGDMLKEVRGIDAMTPIKAEIFSRPNAINGKYKAIGLDIGLETEEAFPSSLPEKIPVFGKVFKASEVAYNAAALRIRADLADIYLAEAERQGIDLKEEGKGVGIVLNSMTGRGRVKLTPEQSKFLNVTLFSVKYVKSQFDVLTAHLFDKDVGKFARKKAAQNLARVVFFQAMILGIAKYFDDDSVELDPRSSNFGKIMVGPNHEFKINITAGMSSMITLASRIVPTRHNGQWGFWRKTAKGKFINIGQGRYGTSDPSDLIADFIKGKASPGARLLLTAWEGRTFSGEKPTIKTAARDSLLPIPVQNLFELYGSSAKEDPLLFGILVGLDALGVNVNTVQKRKRQRIRR